MPHVARVRHLNDKEEAGPVATRLTHARSSVVWAIQAPKWSVVQAAKLVGVKAFRLTLLRLLAVAKQLTSPAVNKVEPGAGGTGHGFIVLVGRVIRQPMLHLHAGLRTFEKDVSAHA